MFSFSVVFVCTLICAEVGWEEWSVWSSCSVSCGGGDRLRTRNCIGGSCRGKKQETSLCGFVPCVPGENIMSGCVCSSEMLLVKLTQSCLALPIMQLCTNSAGVGNADVWPEDYLTTHPSTGSYFISSLCKRAVRLHISPMLPLSLCWFMQ